VLASRDSQNPRAAGGERLLQQLAEAIATCGDEVTFWTSQAPGRPTSERYRGVEILRLAPPGLLAPAVWAGLALGRAARFDLIIEEALGGERVPFFAKVWTPSRSVGMWYQDFRPLFAAQLGSGRAARWAGRLQELLLRLYRSGPVLTCSERSRGWLVSRAIPPGQIGLVYPRLEGVPTTSPLSFVARRNRFVSIGNFRPTKRFEEALAVLRGVRRTVPDAELVLIGRPLDDAYLGRLRELASAPDLKGAVHFIVGATELEKFGTLSLAKALTVHSPIEGFGWTVPEAGSCGVPAVVGPGVPEDVLRPGVSGEVVPFGNVDAYVRVLVDWFRSSDHWQARSDQALHLAQKFVAPTLTPELARFLAQQGRSGR
jgi:glycosyltransferase involved in cell wall biosynthesis